MVPGTLTLVAPSLSHPDSKILGKNHNFNSLVPGTFTSLHGRSPDELQEYPLSVSDLPGGGEIDDADNPS